MKNVVITGASSGLGAAIKATLDLISVGFRTLDWSLPDVNVTSKMSIDYAARQMGWDRVDILINNAGTNLNEWFPDMSEEQWDRVMDTNAKGIFLVSQALLEQLRGGTILNIVSNASRVPMTSSAAYNASKGAAAILTAQMARELKKTHDITVFAISPGKLAGTEMSKYIEQRVVETRGWTPEFAKEYQLAGLKAGEEINIDTLADFIAYLLSSKERHKYLHGLDIPYGG